ncbi:MAG TPA: efflux RND transporter periplasmic adaptor subunit [Verrucomicrobiota bacterium]|nr:efflux RND transporter periplasmic adaptor subunit [Verrucomicrobiota bacterium]
MKKRRSFPWAGLLTVAVLAAAGWYGWQRFAPKAAAPLKYRTAAVTRGDITQSVTANGNIQPIKSVTVGSQVSGQIVDVLVDFNSRVTNGQVLARIDPSTFERALQQAEAELASAEASLALAQVNRERARDLLAANLIPKSEADQAEANYLQAAAAVKMRQANVERAQVDLDRTTILSPIPGIVISRKIELGQTVAASLNTPNLFQLVGDLARIQIEVAVSEADIGGVNEGQRVTFQVDAFPNRTFDGAVRQVRYEAITNQNVITYTTVVDVANDDLKLRPGMTANVSIITAEQRNVLRVPNAALRFRPPEGAIVRGDTNAPAMTGGPAPAAAGGSPGADGMPTPPWAAEGGRPTNEERERWMAGLSPEQRQAMERMRERMRAGGGGPGGGGPGGFGGEGGGRPRAQRQTQPEGPVQRTVYVLAREADATGREIQVLKATVIRTGASDATATEVLEGLSEGDLLVSGVVPTATPTAAAAPAGSPLGGSPFGGGGPRPR